MSESTQREELTAIINATGCGHGHAFLVGAGRIADALTPYIERVKAEAWAEGKNAGAADAAQIIGWGVQGAHPADRPELSQNPYWKQADQ